MAPRTIQFSLKRVFLLFFLVGIGLITSFLPSEAFAQKGPRNKILCTQPIVAASADVTICNGISTTLTASITFATGNPPYTYAWNPTAGLGTPNDVTASLSSTTTATPSVTTTYTITVTDVTGCTSNPDFVTVTVNPSPTITVTGTNTVCVGGSTTLTASGGVSYVWAPGGSTSTSIVVAPTTSTNYTVTGTDALTCTSTSTYSVTVFPQPTVNAGPDVSICPGSNTTLNGSGNGTFLWSPPDGLSNTTIANPVASPTINTTYTLTVTNNCGSIDDDVTITLNASPSVNAGSDVTICQGANTSLVASGSGTYSWTPTSGLSCTTCANPVASPTITTHYTVTISDVCGTASDSVLVTVATPSVVVSGNTPICIGSSSTLTATGGITYVWSTGISASSIIVSPTTATGYTVTITDASGCTDDDSITVNVNPLPVPIISGNTTICEGDNSTLSGSGGTGFLWSTGETTSSIIVAPTSATGYTLTITDSNGCSDTTSVLVNVNPQPTVNAGTDVTFCNGDSATLNASGNGSYNWNPTTGLSNSTISNPVANPTTTITYTISVTNSCGTAVDSVVVNVNPLPAAAINGNDTVCSGLTDTLVASGGITYLWNTSSTNDSIFVNPTSATVYSVIVTDGNGCTASAIFAVATHIPPVVIVTAAQANICVGSCNTLSASGGSSYVWSTAESTSSIVVCPTSPTSYTVTTTDANGCTNDTSALINVVPVVVASVSGDTLICNGDVSTLTAQGGGTYLWSTTETTASIVVSPVSNTSYSVTVSNGACSDTAYINVDINPAPAVLATANPYTINIGATTTLTGVTSTGTYTWSPTTGLSCDTCANPAANPTVTTTYTVITIDGNGCTGIDTVIVNVTMECEDIFVPSAFSPNMDGFNDYLYVRNPCVRDMEFTVYNRWGQKVFFTTDITEGWDGIFHGKPADPAVFFYTVSVNFITGTSKIINGNVTLVR